MADSAAIGLSAINPLIRVKHWFSGLLSRSSTGLSKSALGFKSVLANLTIRLKFGLSAHMSRSGDSLDGGVADSGFGSITVVNRLILVLSPRMRRSRYGLVGAGAATRPEPAKLVDPHFREVNFGVVHVSFEAD